MSSTTMPTDKKKLWGGGTSPFGASYGKLMMWFFLVSDALTFTGFLVSYGFYRHYFESLWPAAENVFTHFPGMHGDHPLIYVALMTFILIMSSVTMVLAVEAGQRMNQKAVTLWMGLTVIGGAIFLGSQAWEWYHFIHGTDLGALKLAAGSFTLPDGTVELTHNVIGRWADESHQILILPWQEAGEYITVSGSQLADISANAVQIHGANLTENEYGHQLFGDFFFFITGFHGTHVLSGVILNLIIFINVRKGTYQKRGHYEMVEKVGLYWHFVDLVWVFVFTFFYLL